MTSEVINNDTRTFVNAEDEEKVVEAGVTKETANVLVSGIKAYMEKIEETVATDLLDFTEMAAEKGMDTTGKADLNDLVIPNKANLDVAYNFKAFEAEEDEQAIADLFAYMGIVDDRQLSGLTIEDIEQAIANCDGYAYEKIDFVL